MREREERENHPCDFIQDQFNLDSQYSDHGEYTRNVKYMLVLLVDVLQMFITEVIHRRLCYYTIKTICGTVE